MYFNPPKVVVVVVVVVALWLISQLLIPATPCQRQVIDGVISARSRKEMKTTFFFLPLQFSSFTSIPVSILAKMKFSL